MDSILFALCRSFHNIPLFLVRSNRKDSEGGVALLITLLVVLLLSVLIFEIDFQARADLRAASNFRDDFAATSIARSGIAVAQQALKEDAKNKDTQALDATTELWAMPIENYAVRDGVISGKITDESGKINLNMLVPGPTVTMTDPLKKVFKWRKEQLGRLFRRLDVNPELVDAIIDWIDNNEGTETYGAENDYYEFLDPAYSAKNGPMETLQELLFVKGISMEIYKKIAPYLTVYMDSANGKLNVNTADSLVLQSLDELISEADAEQIIANRPYLSPDKVNQLANLLTSLTGVWQNLLSVKSETFSIEVTGTVRDTQKIIRAVWNRSSGQFLHFQVE